MDVACQQMWQACCRCRYHLHYVGAQGPLPAPCCRGQGGGELYAAFNAHGYAVEVALPSAPQGQRWSRVVDTNLLPPRDFTPGGNDGVYSSYSLAPFSAVLLVAKAA